MRIADTIRYVFYRLHREYLYRFAPDKLEVIGACKQCGDCCRSLMLIETRGPVRSRRYFRKLQQRNEFYRNLEIVGKDSRGILIFSCNLLGEDGRCTRYDERPDICSEFPTIWMFRYGGELDTSCGYTLQTKVDFKKILEKKMKRRERKNEDHI